MQRVVGGHCLHSGSGSQLCKLIGIDLSLARGFRSKAPLLDDVVHFLQKY